VAFEVARHLGVAAMLLALAAACIAGGIARPPAPAGFTLTLSASPTAADPLLITFAATAVSGTISSYSWNFGDGLYFNGSGSAYAEPVHRYAAPGTYVVHLLAFEGTQSANASLPLTVQSAPLHVAIEETNGSGAAPLTVRFAAVLSGGTGTFSSVLWDFGDGGSGVGPSVAYTFVRSGHFSVTVNVTDSGGQSATARTWANVTAAPTGSSNGGEIPDALLVALVAAATGVAGLLAGIALAARRRGAARAPPSETREDGADSGPSPAPVPPADLAGASSPGTEGSPGSRGVDARDDDASSASGRSAPGTGTDGTLRSPASPGGVTPEALRLSERIVLHLRSLGRLEPSEVAPVGFSQHGMSEALHVRQNALANVLRRLLAAGVLSEELRHVQGQPRRLKVYRLTPRGEALATELRSRGRGAPSVPSTPDR
jgi:PKD repeat protein/DNA-binding MarR family transcriptional regulator